MEKIRHLKKRPTTAELVEWATHEMASYADVIDSNMTPYGDRSSRINGKNPTEKELQREYQIYLDDRIRDLEDMICTHEIATQLLEKWIAESTRKNAERDKLCEFEIGGHVSESEERNGNQKWNRHRYLNGGLA